MNKLIKRTPPHPPPLFSPPLNTWNHPQIKKYEGKKRKGGGKEERGRSWSETENVCVCRSTTTRRKRRGVEPIGEERGSKREKPHELLEWCASSSPLAYPKIPGAGNVKARRTTDAIPQRGSAGIISEGNGGLKWRTNFSKTSSERNVHALRLFLPPLRTLPFSLSLFILPLCCVSETTPLFYQINISQNKSQDNFKLAGEEKRSGVRRRRWGGGFSSSASCEVEFASPASPRFEVCGFVFCISSVWWGRHNCSWMPKEGTGAKRACETRIYIFVSQAKILVDLMRSSVTVQPLWSVLRAACNRSHARFRPLIAVPWRGTNVSFCQPRLKFSNTNNIRNSWVTHNKLLNETRVALSLQSCRNGADEAHGCNQGGQRAPFDDWLARGGKSAFSPRRSLSQM